MDLSKSTSKLFISKLSNSILSFFGIAIFARELGASSIGIFFLFEALLGLVSIPADFGLRGAVEKRISEGESPNKFLGGVILLKIFPVTLIIVLVILLGPFINSYIGSEVAILLCLSIVLRESALLTIFVLKGELRVGETALLRVIQKLCWVVIGGVLIIRSHGVKSLIFGKLSGLFIVSIIGWFKCSTTVSIPTIQHMTSLFDYSKYNIISSLGGYFYSWVDIAIMGLFLPQSQIGAYEIAWRVTTPVIALSESVASSLFPQVSYWSVNNSQGKIESVIRESLTPSIILSIPAFFGSLALSTEVLGIIFGPEFTVASLVLVILMGEKILQSVHVIFGRVLQAINKPEFAAYATLISITANVILNFILIIRIGMIGAAIATTTSFILNTAIHFWYLERFVSIDIPLSDILWCIGSSTIMLLIVISIKGIFNIQNLLELIVIILSGICIYSVCILSNPSLRTRIVSAVYRSSE